MGVLKCLSLLGGNKEHFGLKEEGFTLPAENLQDLMTVEEAKWEWQVAKRYFNEVTEPALIDYAIYNMEAAEKRLVHLIRMLGKKYPDGIWPRELIASLAGAEKKSSEKASLTEG